MNDDLTPVSRCVLADGPWRTIDDALCARFPHVPRAEWHRRLDAGEVSGVDGAPLARSTPFTAGLVVYYRRRVVEEAAVTGEVTLLHVDSRLVVADKPAGLPVMPTGPWVRQTLRWRVREALGGTDAVPLHRLDRDTAGLVLLSVDPATRGAYQALFRDRSIRKVYEAIAAPLPGLDWPLIRRSRLGRGDPFFRMQEIDGEPNAETRIDVSCRGADEWTYRLEPVTGRKHQLRVHMAALGAPIRGDAWYPTLRTSAGPLALLARSLEFDDPVDGTPRRYRSGQAIPGAAT